MNSVDAVHLVRRPFGIDTASALLANLATLGLGFVTGLLIARFLGPEGKGIVTLASLLQEQIAVLAFLGVELAAVHHLGRGLASPRELAGAGVGLLLPLGSLATVAGIGAIHSLFLDRFPADVEFWAYLSMAGIVPILLTRYLQNLGQASGRIVESSWITTALSILYLGAAGAALLSGTGARGVIASRLIVIVVIAIITIAISWRWDFLPPARVLNPPLQRSLLAFGLRGHVGTATQVFNYRLDAVIVALLLPIAELGIYSISFALAEILWIAPNVLGVVLIQRAASTSREDATRITSLATRLTSTLLAAAGVVLALTASPLVNVLLGPAFRGAVPALVALLPGMWALAIWKNLANDLTGRGHPEAKSYSAGISTVAAVILDIVLIPRMGILGAGVASSISYVLAMVVLVVLYRGITGVTIRGLLLPIKGDFAATKKVLLASWTYVRSPR